jgi:Spy/CpxP family protein refolding chaperone
MKPLVARPWIILALIFLLGGVTGSLLTIGFGPRFSPPPPGPHDMGNHWMMRLNHRLNLTDDEQAKIRPIVTEAEKKIESVYRPAVGQISKIMQDANASIAEVLTPDQQAELQKMEQDRQMFSHHMHGHEHGHGSGDFHGAGPNEHPPGAPPATPDASSPGH